MTTQAVDFDTLRTELRRALRHGTRAAALVTHPGLVELLCPAGPDASHLADRAIRTAAFITETIQSLDSPSDAVMAIMLCLKPGTSRMTLAIRREHAASMLGIQAHTFRCEKQHERAFVTELALALYQRATGT